MSEVKSIRCPCLRASMLYHVTYKLSMRGCVIRKNLDGNTSNLMEMDDDKYLLGLDNILCEFYKNVGT
jgi:hypothetical protein